MSGISNQSPAILKKTSGAANIGSTDGTVEDRLAGIELSLSGTIDDVGALQTDVAALQSGMMPKSGATFTGSPTLNYGVALVTKDYAANSFNLIGVSTWNGEGESLEINPSSHNIGTSINTGATYMGTLANGRVVALSWTAFGVALAAGARVNGISTDNTLSGDSDELLCTQKAIKGYVDSRPKVYTVLESRVMDNTTSVEDFDITGYDGYILLIDGVELSGDELVSIRFSTDGGATFSSGGYAVAGPGFTGSFSTGAISVAGTTILGSRPITSRLEINDAVTDGEVSGFINSQCVTGGDLLRNNMQSVGFVGAVNAARVYVGGGTQNFSSGNITLIGVTL